MRPKMPVEVWILVSAAFLIALGYGIVAPILPQIAKSFDVGFMAASAIVSVFAFVRLVFAPAGGALIARLGERRVYVTGLLIVAISSALCGLAGSYWMLIGFRALGGIGSVMFTVSSMGLLVRLSPVEQRGRTSSLYGTAFLLGNILGPTLGSLLSGLGMRLPFFIYAFTIAAAALVVLVMLRGGPGGRPTSTQAQEQLTLTEALGLPRYRALLVTAFANGWTNFGIRIALLPLLAAAAPSIGAGLAGLALTLFALGNAVTQQVSGRLIDRHGRRPFLILGLSVSALATFPLGWFDTAPAFLVLSTVAGVGAAFTAPAAQAQLSDIVGSNRNGGQALSTFSMATDLGSIAGTLLAGAIADSLGFGWAFGVSALVLAVAVVPWLRLGRTTATTEGT